MGVNDTKRSRELPKQALHQVIRRVMRIKHGDKLFVAISALLCGEIIMFSHLYTRIFPSVLEGNRNASVLNNKQDYPNLRSTMEAKVSGHHEVADFDAVSKKSQGTLNEEVKPRVLLLDQSVEGGSHAFPRRIRTVDPLGNLDCCSKDPLHYINADEKPFYEECTPMATWQTNFYPTCNIMHELALVEGDDRKGVANSTEDSAGEAPVTLINTEGSWRMVWKVTQQQQTDSNEPKQIVLKTLRYKREFDHESFHLQHVDSMAMERLTSSPYIANEYGFCGQSVLTEFATRSGRDLIKNKKLKTWQRVQIAHDLAAALADMHSIDYPNATNATFTHNDINIANTIQGEHGRIKFNDFNIGVLLRWNQTKPCGYPVHFSAPLWRSPEEISGTNTSLYVQPEKSDTYALGNLLFQVLTTHQPWTWLEPGGRLSVEEVIQKKVVGGLPYIPSKFSGANKTGILALYHATIACYEHNPNDRPTSFQLAEALRLALEWTKKGVVKSAVEVRQQFDFRGQRKEQRKKQSSTAAAKESTKKLTDSHSSNREAKRYHKSHSAANSHHMSNKTMELLQARKQQVQETERNKAVIARRQASRPKSSIGSLLRVPKRRNQTVLSQSPRQESWLAPNRTSDRPFG